MLSNDQTADFSNLSKLTQIRCWEKIFNINEIVIEINISGFHSSFLGPVSIETSKIEENAPLQHPHKK